MHTAVFVVQKTFRVGENIESFWDYRQIMTGPVPTFQKKKQMTEQPKEMLM
jgi:hypothetical protein